MKNKNSDIEDALFQIRNLEEALNRNAQGILASTMKEEISSLVKESLKEAEEDEEEIDTEVTSTDDEETFDDSEMNLMGDDDEEEEEDDLESDEEETDNLPVANIDLTGGDDDNEEEDVIDATPEGLNLSDDEVITVFRSLDPSDKIVVKKDDNKIHLKDEEKDVEYLIQLGESELEEGEWHEGGRRHSRMKDEFSFDEMEEMYGKHMRKPKFGKHSDLDIELFGDEDEDEFEPIYEIELDEDEDSDGFNMASLDELYDEEDVDLDAVMESKKAFKAKGMGMGNASKFKYSKKPNMEKGFDEDMKEGSKTKFTGKAKFDYKSDVNSKGFGEKSSKKSTVKKVETKEAARTLGNGDRFRGGLPKPKAHSKFNTAIDKTVNEEVSMLREKNEEYRNALNVFREKLNEVAVFNSNLAYATRLFTEHSTTKQEKINILRRFDNVETLKESKTLYKTIKDELSNGNENEVSKSINESVERTVVKTPSSGSAVNLIESKTYENPQFLRMKDLMSKL